MKLDWEDAGTDEPGDQNASSERVAHGYWSLGPTHDGQWGVELIEQDELLQEIPSGGIHLGGFPTEGEAKAAAQRYEDQNQEVPPDNLCGLCGVRTAQAGHTACSSCA